MSGCRERGAAPLPRWPIPELDPPPAVAPPAPPIADEGSLAAPPEPGADPVPEPDATLPSEPAPDAAPDPGFAPGSEPGSDTGAAEAVAAGHAEGLARGLAEGRERGYVEGRALGYAEGREQGYAEGFADASEAAKEALAQDARRVAAIAARLGAPVAQLDRAVEDAVLGLALEVARCVIGSEIRHAPENLAALLRRALAEVPLTMPAVRIALNPADLDLIRASAPDIERDGAVLVADETLERGGAIVVVDDDDQPVKDRRWQPRAAAAPAVVDLSLAARWRSVMLSLFDGEPG